LRAFAYYLAMMSLDADATFRSMPPFLMLRHAHIDAFMILLYVMRAASIPLLLPCFYIYDCLAAIFARLLMIFLCRYA